MTMQSVLPTFTGYLLDNRRSVGLYGEQYLSNLFERQGHKVSSSHKCGDLTVINPDGEIVHVEIKTSRPNAGRWQFNLFKAKHTDFRHSDVVILLCIGKTGDITPFVIPTANLDPIQSITIYRSPKDYSGIYARYRQSIRSINVFEVNNV